MGNRQEAMRKAMTMAMGYRLQAIGLWHLAIGSWPMGRGTGTTAMVVAMTVAVVHSHGHGHFP